MPIPWTNALGGPFGTALLACAPAILLLAALRWPRVPPADRGWLTALAVALLASAAPRAAFHAAAAPLQWPMAAWLPSLDRFATALGLSVLGLLAVGDRGRLPSGGLLLAALVAGLGWLALLPLGATAPPGAYGWWDLGLAALGASVAALLARGTGPAPRWLLAAVAAIVIGSLWDLGRAGGAPTQLGALGARGGALVACAIGLARALAHPGPRRGPRSAPLHDRRDLMDAVAHELRAITVVLDGCQEVFRQTSAQLAAQDLEGTMRTVAIQSHRQTVLMANLAALIERRRGAHGARGSSDLHRHLTESVERAQPQLHAKSLRGAMQIAPQMVVPGVDAGLAGLIVDNLLLGAASRSPYGAPLALRAAVEDVGLSLEVAYQDTASVEAAGDAPLAHFGFVRFLADQLGGRAWREPAGDGGRQRFLVRLPARLPRGTAERSPTAALPS